MPETTIPIEEVARFPAPGMAVPVSYAFSPDDRLVTYLYGPDQSAVRQLYALDIATGERRVVLASLEGESEELSREEALRRQRQRQLGQGITRYAWASKADRILVPGQSAIHVLDGPDSPGRKVVDADGPVLDPQLSPDGERVAYVHDAELYVADVLRETGGEPRQLTTGARGTGKSHGLAEFIAQEEMGRGSGFWWSPDGSRIAFAEVDETHIPVYRIVHQGSDATGASGQEDHRYPFAGEANAKVRLGVVSADGGEPIWMDLGMDQDIYLARVHWLPDGQLWAQIENRQQTVLDLVRFDPASGGRTTVLRETSDVWINLHDMFRPLDSGGFIWASERSGFNHLYLYDSEGALVRRLTDGQWIVDGVAGVDEDAGLVYFTGTLDGPTERHLYAAPLAGGAPRRITREPGMHAVTLDHGFEKFVDVHSSTETPPTATVRLLADASVLATIHEPNDPRIPDLGLEPPELVTLTTHDGTKLHGAIYRPAAEFGSGPYPTIVSVYGGPHAQMVDSHWSMTCAMRAQYLRGRGFLVFVLDNRGSARRGLAFEGAVKHRLGNIEVRDQVEGVGWLVDQRLADPARIGIYGWSYGGYMTLMCMAQAPDLFSVGVVGAPVTQWDGYDTHYTERYMGTPESNPDGYAGSGVASHVKDIKGKLLIVHGLIDENVHFRHTARLINDLIAQRIRYELMLFPDERHMPRKMGDRVYMEERIAEFFEANL
jgi:dipeptidyl-peptidase-4